MRIGFLGPAGTHSQEAVFAGPGPENYEPVPLPTGPDAVAADLYGCAVLESGVEDPPGSETRFVWIGREAPDPSAGGAWKTALMFWEPSDDRPGWLVRCLSEFADRAVNLTRIESRPRRRG